MALVDDAIEIVEDRRAVGDRLLMLPRFEDETQCVHVAVRTDARITEKVPGADKLFAALDEGEAMVGAIHLQMHGHADTRNARHDDPRSEERRVGKRGARQWRSGWTRAY